MKQLKEEIESNFEKSFLKIKENITSTLTGLETKKDSFRHSYIRLVSLQAWRSELLSKLMHEEAEAFFKEAHNDALMSHALARQGAWRVSLMSLRSLIENTLFGLYYYEHPVELKQWERGDHRLGFTEALSYLTKHPSIIDLPTTITGLEALKSEYATLSKAVHGSSKCFRMTREGNIAGLNINSLSDLGAWSTREKSTLLALNLLLTCFFRQHLTGASNPNLRKAISLAIPQSKHADLRANTGVVLRA